MKYLFKISQKQNRDYDTFDSAVVCAESEDDAKKMHPSGPTGWDYPNYTWATSPDAVEVTKVGVAEESIEVGALICASFNAG